MEGDAIGLEPELLRPAQQRHRHLGIAAELARERPFGAVALDQHAAEDARAGRGPAELFELRLAVEGEEPHALLIGEGDVALFLDGVAEGDAARRRRRPSRQSSISLGLATSKAAPSAASRATISRAGLAFTA